MHTTDFLHAVCRGAIHRARALAYFSFVIIGLPITTLLAAPAPAPTGPLTDFTAANALYTAGDFRGAITAYESLRTQNETNAELYYNLGCAYYRDRQIGRALVNFERAVRLAPRDTDIRHNRAFLREQAGEPKPGFAATFLEYINSLLTLNGLTLFVSVLFIGMIACVMCYLFGRNPWYALAAAGLFLCLIPSAGWLYLKIDAEVLSHPAILIAGPAEVRNGPGTDNSVGFTLPEGRHVQILGTQDTWTAIGLPADGLRGWIETKYLEQI
jgi:tetratricopeptide (TPR) repeat protein